MKKGALIMALLFFSLPILAVPQNETLFKRAAEVYNEGDYVKAIEYYQQILDNGKHSAELYFNLGNAHYKLNQIGPSIYYYEKALLLKPNDPEIENNLAYAQNMRLDAIEQMPRTVMQKFYDGTIAQFSFDSWATIAIIFVVLFVLTYLAYFFIGASNQKRLAFVISMSSLVLCVLAVGFAYLQFQNFQNDNPAIVFSKEVRVLAEPNKRSQEVFTLHEGSKVIVLDNLEAWQRIRIADGQTGWLTVEDIRLLKDF